MIGGRRYVGPTTVPFVAKMTIRQDELFPEMFEQSWRALNENFYDDKFHGADWNAMSANVSPAGQALRHEGRPVRPHLPDDGRAERLAPGHHRQARPARAEDRRPGPDLRRSYRGPGLKIAEILKRGPADRRGLNLRPGDFILAIDGVAVERERQRLQAAQRQGRRDGHAARHADAQRRRTRERRVEIRGCRVASQIDPMMYERWVQAQRRRASPKLSNGKLGYIHIPSMDEAGLDRFVRALYSDNFDKEGIVLDVRYNGGGFTHDQVLNYLGGKEHTIFSQRDGGVGPGAAFVRPQMEQAARAAHQQPLLQRRRDLPARLPHLGPGQARRPTDRRLRHRHARRSRLIDGSTFRIPRIGVYTIKGVNMEKEGVMPDVLVEPHPDQLAHGIDVQLDKAVEVLNKDVVAWKKTRPPMVGAGVGGQ